MVAVSQIAGQVVSYTFIISVGLLNIQVVRVSGQDWAMSMPLRFNADRIHTTRTEINR
jgi:hypothetical protein